MTYTCTTAIVQVGIVRTGIALAHTSKTNSDYINFDASVATPSGDTSSFVITVTTLAASGMRTAFFLIVIKTQSVDKMIDFAPFGNSNLTQDGLQELPSITQSMRIDHKLNQSTSRLYRLQFFLQELM